MLKKYRVEKEQLRKKGGNGVFVVIAAGPSQTGFCRTITVRKKENNYVEEKRNGEKNHRGLLLLVGGCLRLFRGRVMCPSSIK